MQRDAIVLDMTGITCTRQQPRYLKREKKRKTKEESNERRKGKKEKKENDACILRSKCTRKCMLVHINTYQFVLRLGTGIGAAVEKKKVGIKRQHEEGKKFKKWKGRKTKTKKRRQNVSNMEAKINKERVNANRTRGVLIIMDGRSRRTIDSRIPTKPGRSTSGFRGN